MRTPVGPIQYSKPEADCAPGRSSASRHLGQEDHAAAAAHLVLGVAPSSQTLLKQLPGFPCRFYTDGVRL